MPEAPPIRHLRLDSGLDVIALPTRPRDEFAVGVAYRVGELDSPAGLSGLAHWVEHLMFRLLPHGWSDSRADVLAREAVAWNAWTSHRATVYWQALRDPSAERERLRRILALEAACMNGLDFEPEACVAERDVVAAERVSQVEAQPFRRLLEALDALAFPGHPRARPVIGTAADIARFASQDAEAFHRTFYVPGNATVLVLGAEEPDRLLEMAVEAFETVVGPSPPRRTLPPLSPPAGRVELRVRDPLAKRPCAIWHWSFASSTDPRALHRARLVDEALERACGPIRRHLRTCDLAGARVSSWSDDEPGERRLLVDADDPDVLTRAVEIVETTLADPTPWLRDDLATVAHEAMRTRLRAALDDPTNLIGVVADIAVHVADPGDIAEVLWIILDDPSADGLDLPFPEPCAPARALFGLLTPQE